MRNKVFAVWALLLVAPLAWAQASIDETKAVKADGVVEIDNMAGSVEVVGWDKPDVQVTGTTEANVERVAFEVHDGRTRVEVITVNGSRDNNSAFLTIHVPAVSQLRVKTVSASIYIKNSRGSSDAMAESLHAETVSGGIRAETSARRGELSSVSGSVAFAGAADTLKCETVSGPIECSGAIGILEANAISGRITAKGVQRETETSTVSGKIAMDMDTIKSAVLGTISGPITLSGSLADAGRIEADTKSGSITVALAGDVSAEIEMKSVSGRLDTNLADAALPGSTTSDKHSLRFTTGSGSGRMRLSSLSGGISVRQAEGTSTTAESKAGNVTVNGSIRIRAGIRK